MNLKFETGKFCRFFCGQKMAMPEKPLTAGIGGGLSKKIFFFLSFFILYMNEDKLLTFVC